MVFAVNELLSVGSFVSRIGEASETSTVSDPPPTVNFKLNVAVWMASNENTGTFDVVNPFALADTS